MSNVKIYRDKSENGLVLVELIVAVAIIGLLTTLVLVNVYHPIAKSKFKSNAQKLINLMQMACESAEKTNAKYEMVFDPAQQLYELREMQISDENDLDIENIIETGEFTDDFILSYVQFDDYELTDEDVAVFRAGKTGFQFGGKVVVLDAQGRCYSLVVNRIRCKVELIQGDVELIEPRDKDDLPF